jgi:hypothetical protein
VLWEEETVEMTMTYRAALCAGNVLFKVLAALSRPEAGLPDRRQHHFGRAVQGRSAVQNCASTALPAAPA